MAMDERDDTIVIRAGEDFDHVAVLGYLRQHLEGIGEGELEVRQFPAGRSNLTYLLRLGSWEAVLRRPPFGPVPPKAHDMEREAALLEKLHVVYPLAPQPYLICRDVAVLGVPFYVMERKHGIVVDDRFPPQIVPTEDLCRRISETVVDTLAELHAIDWRAAGLDGFGYPDGFLQRQVEGWVGRYRKAQTEEIAAAEPLMRWLAEHVPTSPAPTIIHNDFKLNNMLLDPHDLAQVTGVLDWEMTTIGDPLFDLAVSMGYWIEASDPETVQSVLPTVTTLPGFLTRRECMERYAHRTGRDLSNMSFYVTFAYFKLAVIIQQIYARWQRGQTQDARFTSFGERARQVIEYAASRTSGADL
ncbi:MAG TPA: phosphotransferase family protein [Ktedonobacterales bacterium]